MISRPFEIPFQLFCGFHELNLLFFILSFYHIINILTFLRMLECLFGAGGEFALRSRPPDIRPVRTQLRLHRASNRRNIFFLKKFKPNSANYYHHRNNNQNNYFFHKITYFKTFSYSQECWNIIFYLVLEINIFPPKRHTFSEYL